jgi:hypothetical protein
VRSPEACDEAGLERYQTILTGQLENVGQNRSTECSRDSQGDLRVTFDKASADIALSSNFQNSELFFGRQKSKATID